jgi:hypothetical protein
LEEPIVINIGIIEFAEALKAQGISVIHVEWKPPTEKDEKIRELLDKLL